jgi:hypothetical protein
MLIFYIFRHHQHLYQNRPDFGHGRQQKEVKIRVSPTRFICKKAGKTLTDFYSVFSDPY